MLGVAINVHKNIAIDVGYKFNYLIKPETTYTSDYYSYNYGYSTYYYTDNVSFESLSHDLHLGLRFTF